MSIDGEEWIGGTTVVGNDDTARGDFLENATTNDKRSLSFSLSSDDVRLLLLGAHATPHAPEARANLRNGHLGIFSHKLWPGLVAK